MKYIVLRVTDKMPTGDHARDIPFIFPEACVHSEVAKAMTRMFRAEKPDGRTRIIVPISAGFISSLEVGGPGCCYGKSETLGIKSRGKRDDALMTHFDYSHGIV